MRVCALARIESPKVGGEANLTKPSCPLPAPRRALASNAKGRWTARSGDSQREASPCGCTPNATAISRGRPPRPLPRNDTIHANEITIEHKGRRVPGWWWVEEEGMVEVWSRRGRKVTQIGGSPPQALARLMLRELAKEGKA